MLVDMEKKQEQTKHEMMRYTQEAIDRLRTEAITSAKSKADLKSQRKSHAGDLESDTEDGGDNHQKRNHPTTANEDKLEKMLDAFLRAQTEKQHEIDQLAQENKKLLHKQARLRKQQYRAQHATALEPSLLTMAALEAQRFGVDLGVAAPPPATAPTRPKVNLEDKPIQTDTNEVVPKVKPVPAVVMATHEVQTEPEPVVKEAPLAPPPKEQRKPSFVKPEPIKIPPMPEPEAIAIPAETKKQTPPPTAPPVKEQTREAKQEATPADDANARLQHAAHLVGKVALGFLTRKALNNPRNWYIVLSAEALRNALSEQERDAFLQSQGQSTLEDVEVEVEPHMTANELRLAIAECLCGHVHSTDDDASTPTFDFHRVLLYDRRTHEELRGDQELHSHRHHIDVEIIPFFDEAERHVSDLFELHAAVNEQLQDLRRASATFTFDELRALRGTSEGHFGDNTSKLFRATVRIQSSIRRFLARRQLQMLKVERLIDARLLGMETTRLRALSQDSRRQSSLRGRSLSLPEQIGSLSVDTEEEQRQVSERTLDVHHRLADLVREKTGIDTRSRSTKWLHGQLPTDEYERQLEELQNNREKMPPELQQRIHHILEHVESLTEREYDATRAAIEENEFHAARKIQQVVQVTLARRRLKQLLGRREERAGGAAQIERITRNDSVANEAKENAVEKAVESKAQDDTRSDDKKEVDDIEDLDDTEIARLADAYEHAATHQEEEKEEKHSSPKAAEREERDSLVVQGSAQPSAPRPDTPTPDATGRRAGTPVPADEDPAPAAGRSPRPKQVVISPFSKTPLISRRASLTRRGSGYDNAR
ncbi:hypothetical protein PINS_up016423 [Pythium insidiosum]|nr:hypothetical protein PINS_up016423 [Pythium insidiosum]